MTIPCDFKKQTWVKSLIEETQQPLRRSLCRMLSSEDAEDILQETYLKVFLEVDPQQCENLKAYTFRIARNLSIDLLRRQETRAHFRRTTQLSLVDVDVDEASTIDRSLEQAKLMEAIETLPALCKQIFIARKLKGQTHSEISANFGISKKTVESHLSKALKRLRQSLCQTPTDNHKQSNES